MVRQTVALASRRGARERCNPSVAMSATRAYRAGALGQGIRALAGALMLSTGLVPLLLKLVNLEKEVDKLKARARA